MIAEAIREQMSKTIKYVKPVPYGEATGLTGEVYGQMQADFLPVPPLTLHSPLPRVMAGTWSILRETLQTGKVDRGLKEAVAATVSKTNECPYCVDVHASMLHAKTQPRLGIWLISIGAPLYIAGGISLFVVGPASPIASLIEIAGAIPLGLGYILLGLNLRSGIHAQIAWPSRSN